MSFELFPALQWFDNNGNPLSGGLISTFAAGTTTPLATFTDSTGGTPNANPVVLDSAGRGQMWFSAASYKLVIKTSAGATLMTIDNITLDNLAATISSLLVTGNVTIQQSTAATSLANQSSPTDQLQAAYWNGSASATDQWQWQDVLGTGTNPTSTLTLTHSGSSGRSTLDVSTAILKANAQTFNQTRFADQFPGADAGAKIQAAHDDLPATGGIIDATGFQGNIAAASTITLSKPCWLKLGGVFLALGGAPGINITSDSVIVSGITGSPNSNTLGTIVAGNTGTNTVFQTNSSQTIIRDMRITRGVVKTAGAAINITGGGQGTWQNLRIDNTFNGIVMTGGGGYFENINITGAQAMGAGIIIGPVASNTVTSSTFVNVQINGGTATWSDAYLVLDSGTDGMTFLGCQFVQGTNRSTAVNLRNTSTSNDPEWTTFTGAHVEGGSDHTGFQIDAARGLTISSGIIQGLQGILINGGRDIRIVGNQIYRSVNEGIKVTAAVPLLNIIGNSFGDNGLGTNNTFDDIFINAAVLGFNITGNVFGDIAGDAPANKPRNNINVANTGAAGFNIVGNNMNGSTAVTGKIANSSTTKPWNIIGNFPLASDILPAQAVRVDGTQATAAITATGLVTPAVDGFYLVVYYLEIQQAATTSSAAQITLSWFDDAIGGQTFVGTNLNSNVLGVHDAVSVPVYATSGHAITYAVSYASVGATPMKFLVRVRLIPMG